MKHEERKNRKKEAVEEEFIEEEEFEEDEAMPEDEDYAEADEYIEDEADEYAEPEDEYVEEENEHGFGEGDKDVDDLMNFLMLVKSLRNTLKAGKKVPFSNYGLVDVSACLKIVGDLSKNIPEAVEGGMRVYDEYKRILSSAESQAEACVSSAENKANAAVESAQKRGEDIIKNAEKEGHAIIADAKQKAELMVSGDEVVKRAHEEAHRIRSDAEVEAREIRLKAYHGAMDLISRLQSQFDDSSKLLRKFADTNETFVNMRKELQMGDEDEQDDGYDYDDKY